MLEAGDALGAEQFLARAAQRAAESSGAQSAEHAAIQFELASVLIRLGDLTRAAQALRTASAFVAKDASEHRDLLTYLMNLGEVLTRLGSLEEAESVARRGLELRESFYGVEHAGYAYGLESLADVLGVRGAYQEALRHADRAVEIFRNDRNPRIASALAMRASRAVASGARAFDQSSELPDPIFDDMVREVLARQDEERPELYVLVLEELRQALLERRGADAPLLLNVCATLSSAARVAGAHTVRQTALEWLVAALDRRHDAKQSLDAVLGLSLARDEAGDGEGARRSYEDAVARGRALAGLPVTRWSS